MDLLLNAKSIFDNMREGVLIIDKDSVVVYCNRAYLDYYKTNEKDLYGKTIVDVLPDAMLPEVIRTGKPILNVPRLTRQPHPFFVNMYPIRHNGGIVGGVSVVTFIEQAYMVRKLLLDLERSKQIIRRLTKTGSARYSFDDIIALAPESVKTKEIARRGAASDAPILLQSESGTGKELYAHAIHAASARGGAIFLAANCANFSADLLESELFGYAEGAFTGAKKGGKIGLLETAAGGTVFLDEISEMPMALQSKLLRVLQDHIIRPVGDVQEYEVDIRIIAACNANLEQYIEAGKFRRDLYYRLNTFPIHICPLRERRDDIVPLTLHFLRQLSHKKRREFSVSQDALDRLRSYQWPGNIRELRNVLEFVSCMCDDGRIDAGMLPDSILSASYPHNEAEKLAQRVKRFEQTEISRLLQLYGNDVKGKRKAASVLGISLSTLYDKLN